MNSVPTAAGSALSVLYSANARNGSGNALPCWKLMSQTRWIAGSRKKERVLMSEW
jgi:hypothetical protein